MVRVGSLAIVYFVEQQLEGWTFSRAHWPLHLTLVPWFTVTDEEAVLRSLEQVAHETQSLTLAVGGIEQFGTNGDVPVNIIKNQAPAKALHDVLVDTLAKANTTFNDDRFMGQSYVAHVTRHVADRRQSNEGENVLVTNFHLVRLIDKNTCLVGQQFDLRRVQ